MLINDRYAQAQTERVVNGQAQIEKAVKQRADRQEREMARLAAIEDRYLLKEYNDRVAHERRKQLLAQRTEAAQARTLEGQIRQQGLLNAVLDRTVTGLSAVAAGYLGFQGVVEVVRLIAANFESARKAAMDAVQEVVHYKEAVLELAALKGQLGQAGPETAAQLGFRRQTLQTRQDAIRFQEIMLGMGEAAISGGRMSKAEFNKYMVKVGAFQAAEGGDVSAHAQMGALTPLLMPWKPGQPQITSQGAFKELQRSYERFQPGGPPYSALARQMAQISPLISSGAIPKDEAEALMSMFSITAPEEAGTRSRQFVRATIGSLGRLRGAQVEGAEKIGPYLNRLGVTNQMTPAQIGVKINEDLERARHAEEAQGRIFNPYDYLKHRGYGNQEDIEALLLFSGGVQGGVWGGTYGPLLGPGAPTVASDAKLKGFRSSTVGLQRTAQTAGDAGKLVLAGEALAYMDALQRVAFETARLKTGPRARFDPRANFGLGGVEVGPGRAYGQYEEWNTFFSRPSLAAQAQETLAEEARRVGLRIPASLKTTPSAFSLSTEEGQRAFAQQLFDVAKQIEARGGNVLPGMEKLERAAGHMSNAAEALQNIASGGTPTPQALAGAPDAEPGR